MTQVLNPLRPKKVVQDAAFTTQAFRDSVLSSGLWGRWHRTIQCPCDQFDTLAHVTPTTSANLNMPRANCAKCRGRGLFTYTSQLIPIQVGNASLTEPPATIEGYMGSTVVRFTTLQEHPIRLWDRIEIVGAKLFDAETVDAANRLVVPYVERKIRGAGATDALRFPVVDAQFNVGQPGDGTTLDQVTYAVDYCIAATAAGVIVDKQLTQGVDFEITAEGEVDWTLGIGLGTAPAEGAKYAIRYLCHPSYVIKALPFAQRANTQVYKGALQLARMDYCADGWAEYLGADTGP